MLNVTTNAFAHQIGVRRKGIDENIVIGHYESVACQMCFGRGLLRGVRAATHTITCCSILPVIFETV